MKVQFIYTFEIAPQIMTEYNDLYKAFTENRNVFLSYAMSKLDTDEQRESLIKISCCIWNEVKIKLPKWYNDCNGKFWVDDLEIWRLENSLRSKVSSEFIREFNTANS